MTKKTTTKTFRSQSSDHVPIIPTMVTAHPVGFKRIHVFRNADRYFPGIQVVVNTHRTPNIDILLDAITEKIGLINGAKKLYTTSGILIKDINKINDNEKYVASSSIFTPVQYGDEKPIKHRSKSSFDESKRKKSRSRKNQKENDEKSTEIGFGSNDNEKSPINNGKIKKNKKKKPKNQETKFVNISRHHSLETVDSGSLEIELPSDVEHSDEEILKTDRTHDRSNTRRSSRPISQRSSSTSVKSEKKPKEIKKEKVNKSKISQQPNWGDLSSFTKNIETLLRK